jgi:hypothetical protein
VEGYPVRDVTGDATAEFLDCFRGGIHGWVSAAAGACFKNADPRKGNPTARSFLIFHGGPCYVPLINREAAREQGRPCWSDLVRAVWPTHQGQVCLAIITTDTKKRLWIRARVGALGCRTPILVYDSESALNKILFVGWPNLIECLALVEEAYTAGFNKKSIAGSLFSSAIGIKAVGYAMTAQLETCIHPWRSRPEFPITVLVSQKKEESSN